MALISALPDSRGLFSGIDPRVPLCCTTGYLAPSISLAVTDTTLDTIFFGVSSLKLETTSFPSTRFALIPVDGLALVPDWPVAFGGRICGSVVDSFPLLNSLLLLATLSFACSGVFSL